MTTPNPAGITAAIHKMRSILAAKSTWMINYNSAVSDQEMLSDMEDVITSYLIASQPPKGN